MTTRIKHIAFAFLALTGTLVSATAASANVGQALAKLAELERLQTELKDVHQEINGFTVRSYYCLPPDKPDKASAQTALQQLYNRSGRIMSRVTSDRRILDRMLSNDQRVRSALDQKLPGGSSEIIDGSYFQPYQDQNLKNRQAYDAKLAQLNAAPARRCSTPVVQRQPIAIVDPMVEVTTSLDFDPIPTPAIPSKFCHEDEKRELLDSLIALRQKALANAGQAGDLVESLTKLQQKTSSDLAATRTKASKAAHDNDNFALKAYIEQIHKYEAAIRTLTSAIARARTQETSWMNAETRLNNAYKQVQGVSVVDCTKSDLTPANTLHGSQFTGVGVPAVDLQTVEIPSIPDKVCTDEEKQEISNKAFAALRGAWHNRDAWNARIDELNKLIKKAASDARAQLINARNEARTESSKWSRIVKTADEANDKARALRVDDCNGLTKLGKTETAFPGVHAGVPNADTLPYDLPKIPEYVCAWKEKQALIKRAEAARAAASNNHSQWAARANALGDLLYGDNRVTTGRGKLLSAYAEARAQSDYWADQMLKVAPETYWKARNLDVRKCGEDKKSSMAVPGGAGDLDNRLQRARDGAPVYNGGEESGYGAFGLPRPFAGDPGGDSRDAVRALDSLLNDVRKNNDNRDGRDDRNHRQPRDGKHWSKESSWSTTPKSPAIDVVKKTPKTDTAVSTAQPTETTPKTTTSEPTETGAPVDANSSTMTGPGGVVYPPTYTGKKFDGVSLGTRNQLGDKVESTATPKTTTQQSDQSSAQPSRIEVPTAGVPSRNNVTLSPSLQQQSTQSDAPQTSQPTEQGEWRQVAPPTLVITIPGGSAHDYNGGSLVPTSQQDPQSSNGAATTDPEAAALEAETAGQ